MQPSIGIERQALAVGTHPDTSLIQGWSQGKDGIVGAARSYVEILLQVQVVLLILLIDKQPFALGAYQEAGAYAQNGPDSAFMQAYAVSEDTVGFVVELIKAFAIGSGPQYILGSMTKSRDDGSLHIVGSKSLVLDEIIAVVGSNGRLRSFLADCCQHAVDEYTRMLKMKGPGQKADFPAHLNKSFSLLVEKDGAGTAPASDQPCPTRSA